MNERNRHIAAGALAVVGVIHIVLAPEYAEEAAYLGVLFVLGGLALGVLAVRLWRADDTPAWLLGSLIMAAMGVGFVLSRTVGLPGFHEGEWELSGLLCLVLEAGFLGLAARAIAARPEPARA